MAPKISFHQENNIYFVNDECEETLVIVCIKAGCGQEPMGENGVAHLVEHICLSYRHYIPESTNDFKIFSRIRLRSSGVTNYGQTVLMFSFPSRLENIHIFHQILNLVLGTSIVTKETFAKSKLEILAECKQKGSQWYWQQELISFITDGLISELPVGKEDEIMSLNMREAVTFIQKYYNPDNMALVYFSGLQMKDILSDLYQEIPIMQTELPKQLNYDVVFNYTKQQKYNLSICRMEHPFNHKVVEIYYQQFYKSLNLKAKLTRMLFEVIAKKSIEEYVSVSSYAPRCSEISATDKHVSDYLYYAVFTLNFNNIDDTLSYFAEDIVDYLNHLLITEERLKASKESISPFLCEPEKASRSQIFQNISSHIFYGEPIHITSNQYNQLKELLDQVEVNDLINYKNWILNTPCKIVIST
ncbi:insulinase family protein [Paenibacillus sp. FSL H7-0756]|uniref:insulinase family protein n=1 Tax=Paenibacillus sp. FSL H7-0756 TaxID=2954738 RepID=UPI0030F86EC1